MGKYRPCAGKTRWCLVRVPNASLAQEAEMDEETITDMFLMLVY